ncbi:MAG: hypothetical protein UT24_C0029G0008 [Candidatus Woesebacteria bacterium GW2011_GWB1_39_12]|uniref:Uncharacterized protein n=1 Tax=Candidatus Woesebacteria bacterium GW2011_GWB1_39_12 TaxID=1618574 RepID=A0A0G0QBA7_9BACT|nr:MAG: hypothetical protein UT24_C0029G0008 [Candidatus Woesebacteria bacterium GW2011_GWB1_39_12]
MNGKERFMVGYQVSTKNLYDKAKAIVVQIPDGPLPQSDARDLRDFINEAYEYEEKKDEIVQFKIEI